MTEKTAAAPVADRMAAARAARAANKAKEAAKTAPAADANEPAPEIPEPVVATTMEKAALTADAARAKKVAALRAAKVTSADPIAEPKVKVRVTKKGHGQVSMGEHVGGLGDLTYDHNEEPELPLSMAEELEERGFVEIQ